MLPVLAGACMALEASGPPELPREFRGVWVATVDNIDWPSKPGLPVAVQRDELSRLLRRVRQVGLNAVVFQVRTSCDALYASKLEPSSWFVTGEQGKPLGWDPLAYCVKEGHRLGLEVHAWLNPFRAGHPAQKGPFSAGHVSQTHPDWVKRYGRYLWLDPGIPAVREHTLEVVRDIVSRYDVDGVHIDDYFYPYPEGDRSFPDDDSFKTYGAGLSRSAWRRSNVDNLVESLYREIKSLKPWVKFGVSPFGIYRSGFPVGVEASLDQYEDLAADVLKWWHEGWCDYFSPQLYWPRDSLHQPYGRLLDWWASENTAKRYLWPGLYASKWDPSEIVAQAKMSPSGSVLFSYMSLKASGKLGARLLERSGPRLCVAPPCPWLGPKAPRAPQVSGKETLSWPAQPEVRFFAVWLESGGHWNLARVSDLRLLTREEIGGAEKVAVVGVSRSGMASQPTVVTRKPAAK